MIIDRNHQGPRFSPEKIFELLQSGIMDDAFAMGMMAFDEGKKIDDVPFFEESQHECDWRDGFEEGQLQAESRRAAVVRKHCADDSALARLMELSPEAIAQAIDIPLDDWAGNCFAVACQINERLGLGFNPQYGHFRGWVSPLSMFASRQRALGLCNHGWLVTGAGVVVDPTRFVFEDKEPYIHVDVDRGSEYDRGGNTFRAQTRSSPSPFDPLAKSVALVRPDVLAWAESMLPPADDRPPGCVNVAELFWLSNSPLDQMVEMAEPLFAELERLGCTGLFPLDNKEAVLEQRQAPAIAAVARERLRG